VTSTTYSNKTNQYM